MVELNDPNAICSSHQLGEILGLGARQVDHLRAAGVLRRVSGKQQQGFKLAPSVKAYLQYQRAYVSKECRKQTAGYDSARTRRMNALAQAEELELAVARGGMIKRARVVLVVTTLLATVKNHVLAIPSRCTRQIVGQRNVAKVRAILDAACRDTLREAADFGSHSLDEHGRNGSKKAAA